MRRIPLSRRRKKRRSTPGTAPGTLRIDKRDPPPELTARGIAPDRFEERRLAGADELAEMVGAWPLVWLDVAGLGDEAVLRAIGDAVGIHPLALEDVVNTVQRAKTEPFDDHLFLVVRRLLPDVPGASEQVSLVIGDGLLVTFRERKEPGFEGVVDRLRKGQGRIRRGGADYLTYAVIDTVVDEYFPRLEALTEQLDELEEKAFAGDDPHLPLRIHELKRELTELRRLLWPTREALAALTRDELGVISGDTRLFLRDCQDHTVQAMDLVSVCRESSQDLMSAYLSSVSNRMNEVMKVLTMIATVFIPLSFVAGLYGMNFDTDSPWNMPELGCRYGYPVVLGIMVAVAGSMLIWFRRKRWL